jgi:hypothetical protein
MDFTLNRIGLTSQLHSIFGVTLTSLDFGEKKTHKVRHVFDPDPGY